MLDYWLPIIYNRLIKGTEDMKMQVLKGTKREITLMLWNEQLEKAKKRLEESKEWYEE